MNKEREAAIEQYKICVEEMKKLKAIIDKPESRGRFKPEMGEGYWIVTGKQFFFI